MTTRRPLPPDRGHVGTEGVREDGPALDALDTRSLVALLASDQHRAVAAVEAAIEPLARLVDDVAAAIGRGGRLVYLGAGTSGRLGVLDASECPPTFHADPATIVGLIAGGDGALRRSSEGAEDDHGGAVTELDRLDVGRDDVVVGIAAGGTTPWPLGGIRAAKRRGATTGFISCSPCEHPEGCDHLVILDTGPEPLTGSTRLGAGTATKIALNALTTAVFTRLGKVRGSRMIDLRATNEKLRDRCLRILTELFPDLDRAEADRRLHEAGDHLRAAVETLEHERR